MLEKCPFCGRSVFFSSDDCPACGEDRTNPPEVEAESRPPVQEFEREVKSGGLWWRTALILFFTAISFLMDWVMVSRSGSIDLRNRITGGRLLIAGEDPYHFKWKEGDPVEYLDVYENPKLPITKTTVSPTMLLASWPLVELQNSEIRHLWFLSQWLLLGWLWWLWFSRLDRSKNAAWIWTILVVAFTYSLSWRHHIDRGQGYILWAAILGVWLQLCLKNTTRSNWGGGLVAGFLAGLRPPLLLVTLPYMVLKRRSQIPGAIIGLVIAFAAPMLLRSEIWTDYKKGMESWSEIYRSGSEPRPGGRPIPESIEGDSIDLISTFQVKKYVDTSLHRLGRHFGHLSIPDKPVLLVGLILFGIWLLFYRKVGDTRLLTGLVAWHFLIEMFLPAYRNPYNDVMILNLLPLMLMIKRRLQLKVVAISVALFYSFMMLVIATPPKAMLYWNSILFMGIAVLALCLLKLKVDDDSTTDKDRQACLNPTN